MILGEAEICGIFTGAMQKIDGNVRISLQTLFGSHCIRAKLAAKFLKGLIWEANGNSFSNAHIKLLNLLI